jgi:hypothetical protein
MIYIYITHVSSAVKRSPKKKKSEKEKRKKENEEKLEKKMRRGEGVTKKRGERVRERAMQKHKDNQTW